jgi:hypothetical protein
MATTAIELILSVAGIALGIAQFKLESGPAAPDQLALGNSRVRFGFGLSPDQYNANQTMGGRVPSIKVYNDRNEQIGNASSPSSSVALAGQYIDVTVEQSVKFQQASYLEVNAMDGDMVCLAYIGQTWSDGTKLGWLGDIGRFCGMFWYHSTLHIAMENGTLYSVSITRIVQMFLQNVTD